MASDRDVVVGEGCLDAILGGLFGGEEIFSYNGLLNFEIL
jgi:hypothetical protein